MVITMLYYCQRYGFDEIELSTKEVRELFGVSRSTASRIMDYAERTSQLCRVEYGRNNGGNPVKFLCLDVESAMEVDGISWANIVSRAERAQDALGLSDMDIRRMVNAAMRVIASEGDSRE